MCAMLCAVGVAVWLAQVVLRAVASADLSLGADLGLFVFAALDKC